VLGENNYSSFEPSSKVEPVKGARKISIVEEGVDFEVEFVRAEALSAQLLSMIHDTYSDLRIGKRFSVIDLSAVLKTCADSISSNAYAWLFLCQRRNRQSYLVEHAFRTAIYAMAIGTRLGQKAHEVAELGLAALLSDVGKIMIPNVILDKEGALSSAEYAVIRVHPLEGRKILQNQSDASVSVIDVVVSHHERIDGQGYPTGLAGAEISLPARIVAIADAYDAMTCERAYAEARTVQDALGILSSCRGKQFDAELTDVFTLLVGDIPSGGLVSIESGRSACVLEPALPASVFGRSAHETKQKGNGQGSIAQNLKRHLKEPHFKIMTYTHDEARAKPCIATVPLSSFKVVDDINETAARFTLPSEQVHLMHRKYLRALSK